jgi:hypothetical protein
MSSTRVTGLTRAGRLRGGIRSGMRDKRNSYPINTAQLLRHDVMVVGTNAFVAYSLLCNARFPTRWAEANGFDPLNPGR